MSHTQGQIMTFWGVERVITHKLLLRTAISLNDEVQKWS